jgi:hypothetical protein
MNDWLSCAFARSLKWGRAIAHPFQEYDMHGVGTCPNTFRHAIRATQENGGKL